MRILLDASSVEVFLDEGREALSLLVFPGEGERSVELFSEAGTASVTELHVHRMGSSYELRGRAETNTPRSHDGCNLVLYLHEKSRLLYVAVQSDHSEAAHIHSVARGRLKL